MRMSVITPVYNGEKFIEQTINSVLSAIKDKEIEYLVVNDGSTDSTSQILEKFAGQIRIIEQLNKGESSAVNSGFEKALGDFILVVSADDPLLTPAIFNDVTERFDAQRDLVAWYPDWQIINENGNVIQKVIVDEYSDEQLIGRFKCLPGPGTFIRKEAFLQVGGRNPKWTYVGDYDFWLRLSRIGKIEHRSELLAQWRSHDESTSIAHRNINMFNERIGVIEDFIEQNKISPKLSRMARAHALYFAALLAFYAPEIKAKRHLVRAFLIRRKWIEEAQLRVVIYLLLMPLSTKLKPFITTHLLTFLKARK